MQSSWMNKTVILIKCLLLFKYFFLFSLIKRLYQKELKLQNHLLYLKQFSFLSFFYFLFFFFNSSYDSSTVSILEHLQALKQWNTDVHRRICKWV